MHSNNIHKIEKLLVLIASSATSDLSINSLSKKIWLSCVTTSKYLDLLEKLWWIISLFKYWKLSDNIRREYKYYFISTNLMYIYSYFLLDNSVLKWNMRESFVISSLHKVKKYHYEIFFKTRTDIVLAFSSWKVIEIEIDWKNKSRGNVFTIKDDILIWDTKTIPMYLLGFLE